MQTEIFNVAVVQYAVIYVHVRDRDEHERAVVLVSSLTVRAQQYSLTILREVVTGLSLEDDFIERCFLVSRPCDNVLVIRWDVTTEHWWWLLWLHSTVHQTHWQTHNFTALYTRLNNHHTTSQYSRLIDRHTTSPHCTPDSMIIAQLHSTPDSLIDTQLHSTVHQTHWSSHNFTVHQTHW